MKKKRYITPETEENVIGIYAILTTASNTEQGEWADAKESDFEGEDGIWNDNTPKNVWEEE